jgi:hypothetical protein
MRKNYYVGLAADYSRPGLVPETMKAKLIAESARFNGLKEASLPNIDAGYTTQQIERENQEWWPTHCEALRQGRGDLLTGEYRKELVYFCADGPFQGIEQQHEREKHWWALIAQPGVTMCWPVVLFWSEFVHFEWHCLDDATGEVIARGTVCWVRRGHRGGCYYKSEQLTFFRDVYASLQLLELITI